VRCRKNRCSLDCDAGLDCRTRTAVGIYGGSSSRCGSTEHGGVCVRTAMFRIPPTLLCSIFKSSNHKHPSSVLAISHGSAMRCASDDPNGFHDPGCSKDVPISRETGAAITSNCFVCDSCRELKTENSFVEENRKYARTTYGFLPLATWQSQSQIKHSNSNSDVAIYRQTTGQRWLPCGRSTWL